jgi:hypothetical protein
VTTPVVSSLRRALGYWVRSAQLHCPQTVTAMEKKLRIEREGFRVGEELTGAVTRRPPISLDTMAPCAGGYTHDVGVWALSIVQGPFSVATCQTLNATIRKFGIAVRLDASLAARRVGSPTRGGRGVRTQPHPTLTLFALNGRACRRCFRAR